MKRQLFTGGTFTPKESVVGSNSPEFTVPPGIDTELQRDITAAIARAVVRQVLESDEFQKRLRVELHARFDVGHEIVLPERARSDHR